MSTSRGSGVMVPLFSVRSTRSWGVGEFLDMPVFARWLADAGQSFVQILPILEIPDAETSPYSALTAMALDPIYISLPALEDFQALGGETRMNAEDRATLAQLQQSPRIKHELVRPFKSRWLRRAYDRFRREELARGTSRAARFQQFVAAEAWWLDDYALFQALRGHHALRAWWEWPEPLARRHEAALAQAREEFATEIGYRQYAQWVAAKQWAEAHKESAPVRIFGDVPFMISADSPDVWTQQNEFRFDATVGVPPDAFSETGQDWGLPPWRWEVMAENDFAWMRRRARRSAALFDGFRLDHLVGLYRTYIRPLDPSTRAFFTPADANAQLALGERLVDLYKDSGADIIAEDLGTVPDFVRASLARLGVPGYKVLRWEHDWSRPDRPFIDPPQYPPTSVATTGTHDTETLASWWEALPSGERRRVVEIPSVARYLASGESGASSPPDTFTPELNDALLRALLDSGSILALIPVQDIFGWRERVNTPATVGAENWTWRLPWPVDQLEMLDEPRRRATALRSWTCKAAR